ncbi:MAG: hypothetical protein FK733_06020 [Asgard group archaeon]|nr:hypothetical protein [Asgard group archaeon]
MPERKPTPEKEKRRRDFQAANAPESNTPPSEDTPEQDVTPEFEGEALETEGETTEKTRDSLIKTKTKK